MTQQHGDTVTYTMRVALMLAVADVERSVAFYTDLLGFERLEYPEIPLLRRGELHLFLVPPSPPTTDRPGVALAPPDDASTSSVNLVFEVDDVPVEYERLRRLGLEFLTPPMQPSWGGWRCFARDPDGYVLEIEQPE